jgi:hypothetical protein
MREEKAKQDVENEYVPPPMDMKKGKPDVENGVVLGMVKVTRNILQRMQEPVDDGENEDEDMSRLIVMIKHLLQRM